MKTAIIKDQNGTFRKAILTKAYELLLVSCVTCCWLGKKTTMVTPSSQNVHDWEVVDIKSKARG